jgi:hypothetical protein
MPCWEQSHNSEIYSLIYADVNAVIVKIFPKQMNHLLAQGFVAPKWFIK